MINALIFVIAKALGAIPDGFAMPDGNGTFTIVPVLVSSIVPAVVATGVFWLLVRFTTSPKKIFLAIAVVLLVASFVTPFSLPGAPVGMIVALELMHIVAAFAICFGLTTSVPTAA